MTGDHVRWLILSPDDETFAELDFYSAHGVQELLVVDWPPLD